MKKEEKMVSIWYPMGYQGCCVGFDPVPADLESVKAFLRKGEFTRVYLAWDDCGVVPSLKNEMLVDKLAQEFIDESMTGFYLGLWASRAVG